MKAVGYIACAVGGMVFGYLMLSLGVVDAVDGVPGTMQEPAIALPTYLGFMSAMMTAVTAVLAAVAIGIGLVAFFTFREIEKKVLESTGVKVNEMLGERLSDDVLDKRIQAYSFKRATRGELEEGFDPNDTGER